MDVQELKARAREAVVRGRLEQAEVLYRQVLTRVPRDAGAWLRHAETLRRLGRVNDAVWSYRTASTILLSLGHEARAIAGLKLALGLKPDDVDLVTEIIRVELHRHRRLALRGHAGVPSAQPQHHVQWEDLDKPQLALPMLGTVDLRPSAGSAVAGAVGAAAVSAVATLSEARGPAEALADVQRAAEAALGMEAGPPVEFPGSGLGTLPATPVPAAAPEAAAGSAEVPAPVSSGPTPRPSTPSQVASAAPPGEAPPPVASGPTPRPSTPSQVASAAPPAEAPPPVASSPTPRPSTPSQVASAAPPAEVPPPVSSSPTPRPSTPSQVAAVPAPPGSPGWRPPAPFLRSGGPPRTLSPADLGVPAARTSSPSQHGSQPRTPPSGTAPSTPARGSSLGALRRTSPWPEIRRLNDREVAIKASADSPWVVVTASSPLEVRLTETLAVDEELSTPWVD